MGDRSWRCLKVFTGGAGCFRPLVVVRTSTHIRCLGYVPLSMVRERRLRVVLVLWISKNKSRWRLSFFFQGPRPVSLSLFNLSQIRNVVLSRFGILYLIWWCISICGFLPAARGTFLSSLLHFHYR